MSWWKTSAPSNGRLIADINTFVLEGACHAARIRNVRYSLVERGAARQAFEPLSVQPEVRRHRLHAPVAASLGFRAILFQLLSQAAELHNHRIAGRSNSDFKLLLALVVDKDPAIIDRTKQIKVQLVPRMAVKQLRSTRQFELLAVEPRRDGHEKSHGPGRLEGARNGQIVARHIRVSGYPAATSADPASSLQGLSWAARSAHAVFNPLLCCRKFCDFLRAARAISRIIRRGRYACDVKSAR